MRETFIKQAHKWDKPGNKEEMQMVLFALMATVTEQDNIATRDCIKRIKEKNFPELTAEEIWRDLSDLTYAMSCVPEQTKLVNLTSHSITICTADGSFVELKPSGKIARIKQEFNRIGIVQSEGKDIEIFNSGQWNISDLPEPEKNTIYIVSGITAYIIHEIFPERTDVVRPGRQIRKTGHDIDTPVACIGLCRI